MNYEWDEIRRQSNLEIHNLDFFDVADFDWDRVDTMTDEDIAKAIASDPDSAPEWSDDDFQHARPAADVLPQVVESYRRTRGPQRAPTKIPVSIRLNPEIVDYFRAQGQGWQSRINEVLEEYVTSQK